MQDVITILRKRLDDFGVAEPVIRTRGDDMLEIQLPGLNSKDNAGDIEKLKAPAVLDFREYYLVAEPFMLRRLLRTRAFKLCLLVIHIYRKRSPILIPERHLFLGYLWKSVLTQPVI